MSRNVPIVKARSASQIEGIAEEILRRHGPATLAGHAPFDIISFVDGPLERDHRVRFDVQDLGPNIEGRFQDRTLTLNEPVYDRALDGSRRDRFTAAHECGHGVMHADTLDAIEWSPEHVPLFRRTDIKPYLDPEWQANRFAGALLAPVAGMRAVIAEEEGGLSLATAIDLIAHRCQISWEAASVRIQQAIKLGRLNDVGGLIIVT